MKTPASNGHGRYSVDCGVLIGLGPQQTIRRVPFTILNMDSKGQEADSLPSAHSCKNGESEVSDVGSLPPDHVLGLHLLGLLKKVHTPKTV